MRGKVTSRSDKTALLAIAGLTAGFLAAGVFSLNGLPPATRPAGAVALVISVLGGAAGTAILALLVRNPEGSIITSNPDVIRQNRRRRRSWASGSGFGILLAIGLMLGAARGLLAIVLFGALVGFGSVFFILALLAYFRVVRRVMSSTSAG